MRKETFSPKSFNTFLYVIIAVIVIAILVFSAYFVLAINDLSKELSKNKYLSINNNAKIEALAKLEHYFHGSNEEKEKVTIYLPGTKDVSVLLSDLERMASTNGLVFNSYQTINDKKATLSKDKAAQDIQIQRENDYQFMAFMIELEGPYQSINEMVKQIENYERLVEVTSIKYTNLLIEGSETIRAELNINAYLKS